jgi:tripartite ATP-independent transporter DctM subunit
MSSEMIGVAGLVVLLLLILIRVPIGVALIAVSFGGTWIIAGERVAWGLLGVIPYSLASDWALSSIPMFVLMGYIAFHGKLTTGLFSAARVWLNAVPGGLAISAIFAAGGFSAVTGSSVACAASMGRIAIPEMMKAKYDPVLATGCIAAAGTLGALIPPSILMIIYGVIAQVPITDLFIGGVIPGILTALGYIAVVVIRAMRNPSLAPKLDQQVPWQQRRDSLKEVLPTLSIVVFVFGGLLAGAFTPTQAGAVGSAFAVVLCLLRRSLSWQEVWQSFCETLETTVALFVIVIGANLLTRFLAFSGAGDLISQMISGTVQNKYLLLLGITAVYLVLGMFLDPLGAMLLTLPIFLPVLGKADVSLLWFGVFLVKLLEVGMLTPPIGLNVFVVKGVVGSLVTVTQIFRGVMPFLVSDMIVVALMIAVPATVTLLPGLMK